MMNVCTDLRQVVLETIFELCAYAGQTVTRPTGLFRFNS